MKKNYKTIFLAVAVVIIWGLIAYKIYTALNPEEVVFSTNHQEIIFKPIAQKELDTFSLQLNYRDPFLGKPFKKKIKKPVKKKVLKTTKKEEIVFPLIQYNGFIAPKQKDKQAVFMVLIQQKQYLFSKGDENEALKLINGNSEQITLQYKGKKKVFKRQS